VTWTLVVIALTVAGLETVRWEHDGLSLEVCRQERAMLYREAPPEEYIFVGAKCVRPMQKGLPA
jgi:hypothetical protein